MLNQPIHQALTGLGLRGMARAYDQHEQSADLRALTFADRLALMLDVEQMERMLGMGMQEGMGMALGQIDELLREAVAA